MVTQRDPESLSPAIRESYWYGLGKCRESYFGAGNEIMAMLTWGPSGDVVTWQGDGRTGEESKKGGNAGVTS